MTVYEAILKRRSIRSFTSEKVSLDKIDILLLAAMAAPSACNLQPWAFIVINEENDLSELRKVTTQGNYNAPLAIVVCGINKHIPWSGEDWRQDCGGAAQNIMLTCVELGLSSVCVGGYDEEKLKQLLDIPDDVYPMCILEVIFLSMKEIHYLGIQKKLYTFQNMIKINLEHLEP